MVFYRAFFAISRLPFVIVPWSYYFLPSCNYCFVFSVFILDPTMSYLKKNFIAEEKISHSGIYVVDDIESNSSTLTASEVNYKCPTPPLLCKLRKPRVRIKKLPQHVLKKYNFQSKNTSKRFVYFYTTTIFSNFVFSVYYHNLQERLDV